MAEQTRILLIDDDDDCLDYIGGILKDEGYDVVTATDGQEGLEKAISEQPDMIFLDLIMPEMDGGSTSDELRSISATKNIPIVYLTCVSQPSSLYQTHVAFETDWEEYLSKPLKREELLATVKKYA